jgi:hypothetical protein
MLPARVSDSPAGPFGRGNGDATLTDSPESGRFGREREPPAGPGGGRPGIPRSTFRPGLSAHWQAPAAPASSWGSSWSHRRPWRVATGEGTTLSRGAGRCERTRRMGRKRGSLASICNHNGNVVEEVDLGRWRAVGWAEGDRRHTLHATWTIGIANRKHI